jgi:hypothetical protein
MINEVNPFATAFRPLREVFRNNPNDPYFDKILHISRSDFTNNLTRLRNEAIVSGEISALMVEEDESFPTDIRVCLYKS